MVERVLPGVNLSRGRRGTIRGAANARGGAVYFVPLLIGHGGNTGSQSVATVIRAIALKQIKPENTREVFQWFCSKKPSPDSSWAGF